MDGVWAAAPSPKLPQMMWGGGVCVGGEGFMWDLAILSRYLYYAVWNGGSSSIPCEQIGVVRMTVGVFCWAEWLNSKALCECEDIANVVKT